MIKSTLKLAKRYAIAYLQLTAFVAAWCAPVAVVVVGTMTLGVVGLVSAALCITLFVAVLLYYSSEG